MKRWLICLSVLIGLYTPNVNAINETELRNNPRYVMALSKLDTGNTFVDTESVNILAQVGGSYLIEAEIYEVVPELALIMTDDGKLLGAGVNRNRIKAHFDTTYSLANLDNSKKMTPYDLLVKKIEHTGIESVFIEGWHYNEEGVLDHNYEISSKPSKPVPLNTDTYKMWSAIFYIATHQNFDDILEEFN